MRILLLVGQLRNTREIAKEACRLKPSGKIKWKNRHCRKERTKSLIEPSIIPRGEGPVAMFSVSSVFADRFKWARVCFANWRLPSWAPLPDCFGFEPFARCLKAPGRHYWICSLGLLLCCSLPLQAQVSPFSRYHRDQQRKTVVLDETRVLGSIHNGKVNLTEQQAVEMALRHNIDINVERHESLFHRWAIQRRRGIYDPIATFNFRWDRDTIPATSILQGGLSLTNIVTGYDFGFEKKFSNGGDFEVKFSGSRNRTTNFFSSLMPAIDTSLEVLFRQSLLQGFGRIAAEYQVEISRNNLDISEQEFRRRATDVVFRVQEHYWELVHALQDVQVKEKSLQLAQTILDQNRVRLEVGTVSRLDVVQAEAEVALRHEEVIRTQFNYRRTQDQLVKLMTSYRDSREFPGEIVPADPVFVPPPVSQSFDRLRAMAAEMRPELQQADLEMANQKANLDLSRDRLRPNLDLVAGYQQFGLGGTKIIRDFSQGFIDPPIVEIISGGVGNSLEQLFSADFYGYVLGLNLRLPIFNTEARAENAQAQIALDRVELRKESLTQLIFLEIRSALTQIEMNGARLEATRMAVHSARERLEGEEARFDVGVGTTRELIETQRDLLLAESISLRAQVDLIKSHALLDKAVGRTFDRHNIRLSDALQTNVQ